MCKEQGFTLIELMIVVAIIGALAAVAIPAYNYNSTRAKVSEALVQASSAKTAVSEAFISGGMSAVAGTAQEYNARSVTEKQTKYVSDIRMDTDGVISVTLTANIDAGLPSAALGKTLVLTPNVNGAKLSNFSGSVDWACATENAENAGFRGLIAELGTLPSKYAPSECR